LNPLVSIIIPTFNRAHLISETLNSILEQSYTNWECIIVDDGSTDNTNDVVNDYILKDSRFKYYYRPDDRPKGANACRNYGFKLSNGQYINWFDDDDIMLKDFIKTKINHFDEYTKFVIASCTMVNEKLKEIEIIKIKITTNLFKEYVLWYLKIVTGNVMFRKSFLNQEQLFLSRLTRGQETEFFSRYFFKVIEKDYKIIDIPLFLYRQHDQTKTIKNIKYVRSFKESQVYVFTINLKRSIHINDLSLILHHYKLLVNYFFRSIENKHFYNSKIILKTIPPLLYKLDKSLAIKFYILGNFFVIIKRGSYRFESYFKKYQLKLKN
tara:strand:- start:6515 stop:7486 length:972 start_codon:yes stop_codon:yes gene_type:complete